MRNLLLLLIVDPPRVTDDVRKLERRSHELTTEELRNLNRLLVQHVRQAEALVDYAIAIAGRSRAN